MAGLTLPALSAGWKYEGWAVIDGTPVSTGTFTNVAATDEADTFSGPIALGAPNGEDGFFPGEDFLLNAPAGVSFPTNIAAAVISIEPVPDNSAAPFLLKPLVGTIDANAEVHSTLPMGNNAVATNPQGTVTRN